MSLFQLIDRLASSSESVPEGVPCKPEILAMRECLAESGEENCYAGVLDILQCKADYKVAAGEMAQKQMGIAKYKEMVNESKDESVIVVEKAREEQATIRDYRLLWRSMNGLHPTGGPSKTELGMADWGYADQVRLEMGEKAWRENVDIVASEIGQARAEKLFGLKKEGEKLASASNRFGMTELDRSKLKELESRFTLGLSTL